MSSTRHLFGLPLSCVLALGASSCSRGASLQEVAPVTESGVLATNGAAAAPSASVALAPSKGEDAYDLEADRIVRKARAAKELGGEPPVKVTEEVFVVIGAAGWKGKSLEAAVDLTESALMAYFYGRFKTRPARAVSVYLFPASDSYEAYCKAQSAAACISPYGFYDPVKRDIIMNAGLGLGTLTHELVHPIIETDFPSAPTWINEGIASLFEAPAIPREGEIHGLKNWRLPRLLEGLASPNEREGTTLPALFAMGDGAFRGGEERLHYAMARYFCQWMDERGHLWAFYQRWRDNVATDPNGEKAFLAVVGKTPKEMNTAWTRWVQSLGASDP